MAHADSGGKIGPKLICTTILSYNPARVNLDGFLSFHWKLQLESNTLHLFFNTPETVISNAGGMTRTKALTTPRSHLNSIGSA